jgi:hypothetical protein
MRKKCLYAIDSRRISFEDAMAGRLDRWTSQSFVKRIDSKFVTELRANQPSQRRKVVDFDSALATERFSDLLLCLHVEILSSLASPETAKEMVQRIYSLADKFIVRSSTRDGEDVVDVQAIIEDARMRETHRWIHAAETLVPTVYEITQAPASRNTARSIYRHSLEW